MKWGNPLTVLLVLMLLLNICCVLAKKLKSGASAKATQAAFWQTGELNLDELSDHLDSRGEPVSLLYLSDGNFTKYMIERPRLFQSLLLFTATHSKFKCSACKSASELLLKTYSYYTDAHHLTDLVVNFNSSSAKTDGGEFGEGSGGRKKYHDVLFVFVVDIDSSRDAFSLFGVDAVPKAFLLPPSTASSASPAPGSSQVKLVRHRLFALEDPAVFEIGQQQLMLEQASFLQLVGARTGISIVPTVRAVNLLAPLVAVAALLAFASSMQRHYHFNLIFNTYSSCLCSLAAFGVGISGSVFCFVRKSPWVSTTLDPATGVVTAIKVFAEQDRHQYLLEGVIVAALTLVCAGCLFVLSRLADGDPGSETDADNRTPAADSDSLVSTLRHTVSSLCRHIVAVLLLSAAVLCVLLLFRLYTDKTDWYRLREALPPEVSEFFSGKVLKSSGLLKRFCRLAYLWVFEVRVHDFTSLQSFAATKWHPLVTEYLKRQIGISS
jgi:hypothetical protein